MKDGVKLTAVITWGISDSSSWIGGYPNLFDTDYQAKEAFYAVADTDKEIQKINTANALKYDGTDADYEKSFRYQKENSVGTAGNFKAVWNGSKLCVRLENTASENAEFRVMLENGSSRTVNISKGSSADIAFNLTDEIKAGNSVGMEVIACVKTSPEEYYTWNTLDYSDGSEVTMGKINFVNQPLSAKAKNAENIKIDGKADESAWASAESIDVNKYTMGKDGAYGTAKALWDEDYVYVLVEVKDKKLSKASANAYEQDTVEIFIDENNGKTSSYEADDVQLRINYENEVTITDGKSADGYITAASVTDDGYIVEAAIPHSISGFRAGQVIGYDVQINDDGTGDGKRTGIANWSDLSGQGYINTSGFGVLELANSQESNVTGDVNQDGKADVADLVLLQKYLVRKVRTLDNYKIADLNSDGTVNIFDAIVLRQRLMGMDK